jgi:hypothetical protein
LPKPSSYVYSSSKRLVAEIFATARAEQEDDWGLIVSFKPRRGWEKDPAFPDSLRRRGAVKPKDVISLEILDPQREVEAYHALKAFVESFGIRIEAARMKVAECNSKENNNLLSYSVMGPSSFQYIVFFSIMRLDLSFFFSGRYLVSKQRFWGRPASA